MAYFILLAGIVLLLLNYRSWNKLRHTIIPRHTTSTVFPPLRYLQARWLEWQSYALGNRTLKESKGALAAIGVLCALLFLNANWLQFRLWLFIPMILPLLFMAQISIGRTLERRYFENAFPEVLSVISASISAGNSIHQALHRCGESIEGPLGNSFRRIVRRLNLGEEPERVLNDACREYRYREFYFFVAVMLISLQHGGQLRMLIGRLNRIVTNSRNMSRRKLAMTSEARASAKIVAAIPLLFFCGMKYLSPENFDFIINDPTGQLILYYVIASECIGMLIIWLLLRRAL